MTLVKICGITSPEDAMAAVCAGADLLGLVFARSSRQVTVERARQITAAVSGSARTVGVFVNASVEEVRRTLDACEIDFAQLHGDESPEAARFVGMERTWKAFRVVDLASLQRIPAYAGTVHAVLLDTYRPDLAGGTGERFDWDLAMEARRYALPIVLAGGLNGENVGEAIARTRPFAVDVSTGVEAAPGRKDHARIRDFIHAAREADRQTRQQEVDRG